MVTSLQVSHSAEEFFYQGKNKIHAVLEIDEGASTVYLESGDYSGTLEFVKTFRALENFRGGVLDIKSNTLHDIIHWATEQGY